jgi:hypothetical protein
MIAASLVLTSIQGVAMGAKPNYKEQIKQKLVNINLSDGISEEEAIIIAQNYIIDKGIDKDCLLDKPKVTDKGWSIPEGCWEISFEANANLRQKQDLEWFYMFIEKDKGTIKGSGWSPDL